MGCCGCKQDPPPATVDLKLKPLDNYFQSVEAELTQASKLDESPKDRLFNEIESVALDLLEKATWKELLHNDKFELKFCEGSVYTTDVHVISFKLCFQEIIDLDLLTRLLNDPESRVTWDNSLDEYRVLSEDEESQVLYFVVKMPFIMSNRDFVERQSLVVEPNRVRITGMSADEIMPKTKFERGKTYFRYQVLQHGTSGTEVHSISQVNLAGPIQKSMTSLGVSAATKWAESLIIAVRESQSSQL